MASYMDLIERVKPHPEIWQLSHPLFKNKMVRVKFWRRIAKDLKTDEQQLRKNWKYLADQYRREYKKTTAQEIAVGEAVACGWAYYEALSFLKAGVASKQNRRKPMVPVSSDSDNNDTTQEPTQSAYPSFQDNNDHENLDKAAPWPYVPYDQVRRGDPPPSKADFILRQLKTIQLTMQRLQQASPKSNDEDDMFFFSILPLFKTLSPLKKLQLRGKINDWLLEAMSEREADPLISVSQYSEAEQDEDNKQAIRDQIMAAEDDD